jgi:UDP-N-acetylglucosamine 4,6-dehydratase/5-epimerase
MFKDKTILVTGGTGSFGRRFIRMTLEKYNPKKIIVYSRDEMKQYEMSIQMGDEPRIRYLIGDVRDKDRLKRACQDVDYIVHAAALKIVPSGEYNPFEFVKTNVMGAMNVIDCAIDSGVNRVIALSTDKASNPINLYGATKLCSDKLFISGNYYAGARRTRFAVVRYGNVMGSRGSIIPRFRELAKTGEITITDQAMTRFMITLEEGVRLVWTGLEECLGGEIYVPKIPSMKVVDVAKAIAPDAKMKIIGIRPGEKMHEQMIGAEDARMTYEYDEFYKIFPQIDMQQRLAPTMIENIDSPIRSGRRVDPNFIYSSESNDQWMSVQDLQEWIENEYGASEQLNDDKYSNTAAASIPIKA